MKWWMLGGFILISLLSMGKNFNALYQTLFDYFPLFNKFRTPNSALSVVAFIVPALGFLGLSQIIKTEKDKVALLRPLYIAAGALGAICLFFALLGSGFFDFAYVKDQAYAQNYNINLDALKTQRAEMMSTDSWRSLGLIAASSVLLWLFLKSKINQTILLAGLAVLTIGDLWSVNKKYLNSNNFVEASQYRQVFSQRPVDTKILADKDPHYRVFDITKGLGGAVNSSDASYYHKNIGGYHPAKLQRYQDVLDYHILPEGQQLISTLQQSSSLADIQSKMGQMRALNMLNTKYIIVNNETPIPNNTAYGNAWFVNGVQMVNTPNEEINAIRNIDPQQTAIVNNEFSNYVAGMNFNKNGSIQLTGYHPQKLSYQSNSSSDQLAVFSEVWYGPDKGWQAMIDGNPVEHIRVNYLLRALKVPAGQHTIEFVFNPSSYRVGTTISLISSLAIILGLLGFVGFRFYQQSQQPAPVPAKPTKPATKAKLKPTTSTKKKKSKGKKS
ncbi:MAG: YfhO family protein [Bacteroidota bacterium]